MSRIAISLAVCVCVACGGDTVIFMTSATSNGNLAQFGTTGGGLDGADELCKTSAVGAGFDGTFRAWLSDENTDAIDRITGEGPWRQPNSKTDNVIFNNKTQLQTTPNAAVTQNERGEVQELPACVWTGTTVGGRKTGHLCGGWMATDSGTLGTNGITGKTDNAWTAGQASGCDNQCVLICLQVE